MMEKIKKIRVRWQLLFYDAIICLVVNFLLLCVYKGAVQLTPLGIVEQVGITLSVLLAVNVIGNVYGQIWRYGGIQSYTRLLIANFIGLFIALVLHRVLPIEQVTAGRTVAIFSTTVLLMVTIRVFYRYAYQFGNEKSPVGRLLMFAIRVFAGSKIQCEKGVETRKIRIAIIGAGRVGANLAEELLNTPSAPYLPRCFVDVKKEKIGREIHGLPVIDANEMTKAYMDRHQIQEVVFAIPNLPDFDKKSLYDFYLKSGYKIKVYDHSDFRSPDAKRQIRDFDIEDLLFRKPIVVIDDRTSEYYKGKSVLITGGGGSIGSELCRQLAKMEPKEIIVLDVYENGAYDVQQELKITYKNALSVSVEIVSITNEKGMERVFAAYRPQIVINAAAHKHVPLMEHNCVEAVENNVFGAKVLIDLCEKYKADRFMMVSTDKAVNPTNVMGATKRMCEMLAQSASIHGSVKYSATRFGNVLGSAGSVIPLFKKQIANGGPITVTDKRIVRYFMTIPEAAQLVLESGAMAKNGDLFVLDMGLPVKILDLAENMIRLSGAENIEIIETGLRPGEKLYEELLVKTEKLDKTDNELIFIERDEPVSEAEIEEKLRLLTEACKANDDDAVRQTLMRVVPTFRRPEEVNAEASEAEEMLLTREPALV